METSNQSTDKWYIGLRVCEEGPYNHSENFTVTMDISGGQDGRRWIAFERKTGTSVVDFYEFILRISRSIGRGK